jgi:hypothetical protein
MEMEAHRNYVAAKNEENVIGKKTSEGADKNS